MRRLARRQGGYTLLELVIAIAIMGLLLSISVGSAVNMTTRANERAAAQDLNDQIALLRRVAMTQSTGLVLDADTPREQIQTVIDLPNDWSIEPVGALIWYPSGLCEPGRYALQAPSGRRYTYEMSGVQDCAPRPVASD